ALIGAPRALNPLLAFANPVDRDLTRLLFSGLTGFDTLGRPTPDLANWFISEDQLTYTFLLKPGAQWHDGAPLTAEDVAFTVELLRDPAYPGPQDLKRLWQMVSVAVTGTQTIAFTLPEPFAPFLDYTRFGILPKHLLEGVSAAQLPQAQFNLQPVGSGPFRFRQWLAEGGLITGLILENAPNYHGRPAALAEVEFRFYPNSAEALAAYRRGEVLGISRLDREQVAAAALLPNLRLYTTFEPEYTLIFLNLRDDTLPFFREKRVRQALLLGLNRSQMVNDILHGQAVIADSPVMPGSWAYNLDLPTVPYNPIEAENLLNAAGWVLPQGVAPGSPDYVRQKNNVALRFTLTVPNNELHLALAQAAQADWAALGIQVEIVPVEPTDLRSQALEPRAYQALLADFSLAGTPDPDPYPLWHETQAESGQNYGGWTDRIASQWLEQARLTSNIAERARLYQQFQVRFADQVPALLLYYPVYTYAVDAEVNGVRLGPLTEASDRFATLPEWFTETRRVVVERPSTP
ncbi:MAG: peptide ABC transporter substrate-binding protein, partial [Anaerolineales bacterium]|nr:peptide ABC transporter substrate-binding protein [Anaerolineales bacterium]